MIYERRVGSRATASLRAPSPPLTEFPTIGTNRSAFTIYQGHLTRYIR
jgi:hypothetical protein